MCGPIQDHDQGLADEGDVELGEAEWNLDVVEALMDIYYVQPARMAAKRVALNQKLTDAGKKSL